MAYGEPAACAMSTSSRARVEAVLASPPRRSASADRRRSARASPVRGRVQGDRAPARLSRVRAGFGVPPSGGEVTAGLVGERGGEGRGVVAAALDVGREVVAEQHRLGRAPPASRALDERGQQRGEVGVAEAAGAVLDVVRTERQEAVPFPP